MKEKTFLITSTESKEKPTESHHLKIEKYHWATIIKVIPGSGKFPSELISESQLIITKTRAIFSRRNLVSDLSFS